MSSQNTILIAVTLLVLVSILIGSGAWLGRYSIVGGDYAGGYVLDRWTGEIRMIRGIKSIPVLPSDQGSTPTNQK